MVKNRNSAQINSNQTTEAAETFVYDRLYMKVSLSLLAVTGVLLAACSSATAAIVQPFTETFSSNASSWTQNNDAAANWLSSGGVDDGGYITTAYTVPDTKSGTPVVARATGTANASGGAFIGDYSSITTVSFYVKSDATFDVPIGLRLGGPASSRGSGITIYGGLLTAGSDWTLFTFDLSLGANNPNIISYEGTQGATDAAKFANAISNVANLQVFLYLGATDYTAPTTATSVTFSVDNVSAVPEPSTWAMILASIGLVVLIKGRRSLKLS